MSISAHLELPTIEQLNQAAQAKNCIRAREHRGYSLYRIGPDLLYKRYHYPLGNAMDRQQAEWEVEHAIMCHLQGQEGIPRSFGFMSEQTYHEQRIHALREYIAGETVQSLSHGEIVWLGKFFANLHSKQVTTNDPQLKNLVRDPQSNLFFVDYGKATLFQRRKLRYFWQVGRELFDIMRCMLKWHRPDWKAFYASYRQHASFGKAELSLIRCSYLLFYPYRYYRNLTRRRRLHT